MDTFWYIAFFIPAVAGGVGVGLAILGIGRIVLDKCWDVFWYGAGLALVGAATLILTVHLSPYRHTFWN